MTGTKSNFRAEVWSQKINSGLDTSCVMLQCVNRDYQADANKGTGTVNIVAPGKVSVAKYEGIIPSYEAISADLLKLNLDQEICFSFQVKDIEAAQSNIDIIDNLTRDAKKSIERYIDAHLFGFYTDAAPENCLGDASTPVLLDASNIYANFVALAKSLKLSGALNSTKSGWVVVHPDVEELLLLSEEFSAPSVTGDAALRSGSIGKVAGLDVFVSGNVGKTDDGYVVLAGTQDAITYAAQLSDVETIRSQDDFSSLIRGLYTYGALALNPGALSALICDVK